MNHSLAITAAITLGAVLPTGAERPWPGAAVRGAVAV